MTNKPRFVGEKVRISDAFDLRMGKTPSRKNPSYWCDGSNDWVSIADLGSFGKYVGGTKERINDLAIAESGIKPAPANTVLMSFKLSLGKVSITTSPVYTNEAIMAFVDKGTYSVDPSFMYHQCRTKDWTDGTNTAVMGKTLNKKTLGQATIFLPELAEQKSIAARLDFVDYQINSANKQLSDFDSLVKSRFVEMFGGSSNEMLLRWPTKKLDDCVESIDSGKSPNCRSESRQGNKPAVLKLSALSSGIFLAGENKVLPEGEEIPSDKEIRKGDILVARKNTPELVGACVLVKEDISNLMFPDLVFRMHPFGNVEGSYLSAFSLSFCCRG